MPRDRRAALIPQDPHFADRFEITTELGGAAMSRVFLARDRLRNDPVVVKRVDVTRAEQRARFDREVNVLRRLSPLPTALRYRTHGAWSATEDAIVTDWIAGEDLAARLARGCLTIEQCLRLGVSVATALADIHALGITHGDVKPANLLLVDASLSDVRLVDFGLASMGEPTPPDAPRRSPAGTPAYMAPECLRCECSPCPAVDLYSLGAVLFECLTGRGPSLSRHALGAMTETLLDRVPRVRTLRLSVPPALDALVAALLSRDPAERPPSALAVRDALLAMEPATKVHTVVATPEQITERRDRALDALRRCELIQANRYASEALAMNPPDALKGELLTVKSEARLHCGEVSLAADRAELALGLLRPGDPWWFRAARVAITARGQMGQVDRVMTLAARLGRERPLDGVPGALAAQLECVCSVGIALAHNDATGPVDGLLTDLEARAQGFNQEAPELRARLHLLHAARHEAAGDLASAVLGAKSSLAVAAQAGIGIEALVARVHLGRLLLQRGDLARATAQLTTANLEARAVGARLWEALTDAMLAALDARTGDVPAAFARAEQAQGACEARGACAMASVTRAMVVEIERSLRGGSLPPPAVTHASGAQ